MTTSKSLYTFGKLLFPVFAFIVLTNCGKSPTEPSGGNESKITVDYISPPSGLVTVGQNYSISKTVTCGSVGTLLIRDDGEQRFTSCSNTGCNGSSSESGGGYFQPGDRIYDFGRGHTVTVVFLFTGGSFRGSCPFLISDNPPQIDWTKVERRIDVAIWNIPQ